MIRYCFDYIQGATLGLLLYCI